MPLLTPPSVRSIGTDYAVSFSYYFQTEVATPQNVQGIGFEGVMYQLNAQTFQNVQNFPAFKSMQFSISFLNLDVTSENSMDGPFYIVVPATGQVIRLAPQLFAVADGGTSNAYTTVITGVVPLPTIAPSIIQFIKQNSTITASPMYGTLTCTLFTFDVPPYIYAGSSSEQVQ